MIRLLCRGWGLLALLLVCGGFARAAEVMPPKPTGYFNDYAGVVSKEAALQFNEQLAQFERETSNQVVVAVFRTMQSDSSIEDYAQRVAQSWGVGRAEQSRGNGVVLLVFLEDRKMSIQVGYGLEGALPDVTAFDIRSRHINPHFREGNYEQGLRVGIDLILQALRGEYAGTGATFAEGEEGEGGGDLIGILMVIGFVLLFNFAISRRSRKRRRGHGYSGMGGPFVGGWSSGGGGSFSGSSSGGGFSSFGGGGGSFGGGGSSGSW